MIRQHLGKDRNNNTLCIQSLF